MANGLNCNYLKQPKKCKKRFKGKNKPAKKRIRQISKKRREENKIYSKLRKEYLAEHPKCEICQKAPAQDIHHKRGRRNGNFLRVETFCATCRRCHTYLHANPKWAEENGYLIRNNH